MWSKWEFQEVTSLIFAPATDAGNKRLHAFEGSRRPEFYRNGLNNTDLGVTHATLDQISQFHGRKGKRPPYDPKNRLTAE